MITGSAKIFLNEHRGCTQTENYRSYHTLNFGSYYHPDKIAINSLTALNDEVIQGSYDKGYNAYAEASVFLLPVIGTICYRVNNNEIISVEVGRSAFIKLCQGDLLEFLNQYETELVNFIHIWLASDLYLAFYEFQFELSENQLILIARLTTCNAEIIKISIGQFKGRKQQVITLERSMHLFVFVIEGAFEFQNRLLQPRDSLLLTNFNLVEFEALSNSAIIMLVEFF